MTRTNFRVGVCECPPELRHGSPEWTTFCRMAASQSADLFMLNEMPFGPWTSAGPVFDERAWNASCEMHEDGMRSLGDLGSTCVAGTRPLARGGHRVNQAFLWNEGEGITDVHTKQYFPDEDGYYEARWFHPGEMRFQIASIGPIKAAFLICTEVMFNEHARQYGRAGANVIMVPRAVGGVSLERWLVAMRMAAIVSGCYVLSSNRSGIDSRGQSFGGTGWIVNPFGDLVAKTSGEMPVVCHEIDLDCVRKAQQEYPCYVREMS